MDKQVTNDVNDDEEKKKRYMFILTKVFYDANKDLIIVQKSNWKYKFVHTKLRHQTAFLALSDWERSYMYICNSAFFICV